MKAMTNDELPEAWLACSLGDVIDYGKTTKAEPSEIADDAWILELEDIEKDTSKLLERRTFAERQSKSTKNRFEVGDVLYGKLRPYLNKVIIADQPGCCTTEIIPLKPNVALNGRYLFAWLKHPVFLDYVSNVSHGLNMPRLGTDAGKAAPFILAPLAEQKRIADKLEAVLGRVDACRARLDRVPDLLKRFRQSVLAAATSGQLTEDWREENRPPPWQHLPLGSLASEVKNGLSPKPHEQPPGTPILRISSVRPFRVYQYDIRYLSADLPVDTYRLKIGDLLFTRYNGSLEFVGVCGLVRKIEVEGLVYPDKLIRVRVDEKRAVPAWIEVAAGSRTVRDVIENTARTSAGQTGISGKDIKELVLPVPSLPEQAEIVRRVEALFALADRIEARLATAQRLVERLTPATLSKAFRGDLVPQDPDDEPASKLLQRLQTAAAPGASRRTPR